MGDSFGKWVHQRSWSMRDESALPTFPFSHCHLHAFWYFNGLATQIVTRRCCLKQNMSALFCGVLFSLGLGISGMVQPQKVTGFLDLFGSWDPSLIFVMFGAILVYSIGYRVVIRRKIPLFADNFVIPTKKEIDWRLLLGSSLFGIGWGLAGYCPGPAITSFVSFGHSSLLFVSSMLVSMFLFEQIQIRKAKS